jgi:hypothetical protein
MVYRVRRERSDSVLWDDCYSLEFALARAHGYIAAHGEEGGPLLVDEGEGTDPIARVDPADKHTATKAARVRELLLSVSRSHLN